MIGKTPFYYLIQGFSKWMLLVVNVARHALNHNLFKLTEV